MRGKSESCAQVQPRPATRSHGRGALRGENASRLALRPGGPRAGWHSRRVASGLVALRPGGLRPGGPQAGGPQTGWPSGRVALRPGGPQAGCPQARWPEIQWPQAGWSSGRVALRPGGPQTGCQPRSGDVLATVSCLPGPQTPSAASEPVRAFSALSSCTRLCEGGRTWPAGSGRQPSPGARPRSGVGWAHSAAMRQAGQEAGRHFCPACRKP